ncbi:MAG: molybdopterin molybdotransferase MoeA [Deltaproteobacteria bacterium]|nr:molybdopterin molybdotransferase MoeA [Deltaproteobacteria bacterium]
MLSLTPKEDVLVRLAKAWEPPLRTELVAVTEALGRILAQNYYSLNRLPQVRSAAMDGYAVKSAAFSSSTPPDTSDWVLGIDYQRADMGDDFDDAFDAVILVEEAQQTGGKVSFKPLKPVVPGLNVRPAGSQIEIGDLLAKKFRPLLPKDLAMLQMGGAPFVEVLTKPLVAYIPTGTELINPGEPLRRGVNIDTNSILAQKTLELFGAAFWKFPIIKDDPLALVEAFEQALAGADIVVLAGGSSKGGEDYCAKILGQKAQLLVRGVAAAPGKPMGLFIASGKPVVNLPGPMIAAYYGLEWCLSFLVARWLRQPVRPRPKVRAVLTEPLDAPKELSFLFNLKLSQGPDGGWLAKPLDPRKVRTHEGIDANAHYMSELGRGRLEAGEEIVAEVLRWEEILV